MRRNKNSPNQILWSFTHSQRAPRGLEKQRCGAEAAPRAHPPDGSRRFQCHSDSAKHSANLLLRFLRPPPGGTGCPPPSVPPCFPDPPAPNHSAQGRLTNTHCPAPALRPHEVGPKPACERPPSPEPTGKEEPDASTSVPQAGELPRRHALTCSRSCLWRREGAKRLRAGAGSAGTPRQDPGWRLEIAPDEGTCSHGQPSPQ